MIIYNKLNGEIIANVPEEQDVDLFVSNYDSEVRKNVDSLIIDNPPEHLHHYRIIDSELIKLSEQEIKEKRIHGKILTEEERLLNKLVPLYSEIQKAEQTIEILSLLQEVL